VGLVEWVGMSGAAPGYGKLLSRGGLVGRGDAVLEVFFLYSTYKQFPQSPR
jgi:hypothetical protein